jgi:hypothetical protein
MPVGFDALLVFVLGHLLASFLLDRTHSFLRLPYQFVKW